METVEILVDKRTSPAPLGIGGSWRWPRPACTAWKMSDFVILSGQMHILDCSKFWSKMGERPGQRQIGGEVECEEAFAQAGGRDQGVPRCVQEGGWMAAWKAAFALTSEFSIFGFSSST